MVAQHQALTKSYARQLLAVRGSDVLLPAQDADGNPIADDRRTVRGIFKLGRVSVVDEFSNITYQEYLLRIPPGGLGSLSSNLVVTIDGSTYYVANVAPEKLGWHLVTLQDHDPDDDPC